MSVNWPMQGDCSDQTMRGGAGTTAPAVSQSLPWPLHLRAWMLRTILTPVGFGLAQQESGALALAGAAATCWQQDLGLGRSLRTEAGICTLCATAQASFCSRVKQQQWSQQSSAFMQPQDRSAQAKGVLSSFSLGRGKGAPKQAIR